MPKNSILRKMMIWISSQKSLFFVCKNSFYWKLSFLAEIVNFDQKSEIANFEFAITVFWSLFAISNIWSKFAISDFLSMFSISDFWSKFTYTKSWSKFVISHFWSKFAVSNHWSRSLLRTTCSFSFVLDFYISWLSIFACKTESVWWKLLV